MFYPYKLITSLTYTRIVVRDIFRVVLMLKT